MIKILQKNFIIFISIIPFLLYFTYQENTPNIISFSNFQNDYLLNQSQEDIDSIIGIIKIILLDIKINPQNLTNYLESMNKDFLKEIFSYAFDKDTDYEFLIDIIENFKTSDLVGELIKKIKKNNTIIDDIIYIIENINSNDLLVKIKDFFINYPDMIEYFRNFINKYPDIIYILRTWKKTKQIINNNNEFDNYLDSIKDSLGEIFDLFIKIITKDNEEETLDNISLFLKKNIGLVNDTLIFIVKNIDKFYDTITNYFKSNVFLNEFIFKIFTEKNIKEILQVFINDRKSIEDFADYLNKTEKFEHLTVNIIVFCINNNELIKIFGKILKDVIDSEIKVQNKLPLNIYGSIVREIVDIYVNHKNKFFKENLSEECLDFLNYTFLGTIKDEEIAKTYGRYDKKISGYYLYKLIIDSTKDRNDIISYENCLEHKPTFNGVSTSDINYIGNFPTYVISLIDFTNRSNLIKNSTFYENYKYILGFCLPQSNNTDNNTFYLKNRTKSYYHCKKEDYEFIIRRILEVIQDIDGMNIDIVEINEYNNKMELSWKGFFIFFILMIPIIIYIFLLIYRIFAIKEKKNVIVITNLKNKEEDNDEDKLIDNSNSEEDDKANKKKVKIVPKWYKLLNTFFNFKENIKELFYFESNKTNINDIRGLNYINGLIGISIILTILGQLYLIFFNIPIKRFGSYQFYELMKNPFYVLLFIGLRYSPRVLFSCSGYTLTYKYLSYIERGFNCYLIKFIFYQLYKYIMLIIIVFNLRYSLYFIISFISEIRPMWKFLYEHELKEPDNFGDFVLYLLDIHSISDIIDLFSGSLNINSHDLLDYFWISFNEIFFFIFGILLLSIGYKAHIRIDYIIFSLIILIFGFKIGLYCYYHKTLDLYTTLYYYLFDYGYIMIFPFFNLIYFLIGMYFGLINYSLQNGIIDLYIQNNSYKRIINKEKDKNISSKSSNNNNSDNNEVKKTSSSNSSNYRLDDNNDIFNNNDNINKESKEVISEELKEKNEININGRGSINSSFDLNDNLSNNENNKKDNNNYVKELQSMPFLISTVYIIKWNKKENLKLFFNILLFILFIIIILFSFSYLIFIYYYDNIISNKELNNNYSDNDQLYEKLSLESFLSNPILNFIYLIDIELVVIFIQLSFLILCMKGHYFINDFFSHIYWSFFTKSYFSFQMVCNPIILFMFYQSETIVKLTLLNILLYFIINTVFIIIFTILIYVIIELPLKKIFKYIIKRDINNLNLEEQNDEEEDDNTNEEEEDDDDENENKKNKKEIVNISNSNEENYLRN